MSNLVQVLAGMLLIFFLPGYTLVCVLFPRRGELDPEYDIVYRIAIGMGLSIVIAIIVGFALNSISSVSQGYVAAGPLWIVLLTVTGVFALVGWLRGAYPSAGYIHPLLYRPPAVRVMPGKKTDFATHMRTEKIILEREHLVEDIKVFSARSSTSNPQRQLYYRRRVDQARQRIDQINEELKSVG